MLEKDLKKVTEGVYPFHMPGHKRQKRWTEGLFDLDITEIQGADDLHAPSGIIAEAQRRASALFKTVSTTFLVGGSTCGILAAISAAAGQGDPILIARNCHKSVYNACLINQLSPHFVYPTVKPRLGVFAEVLSADISRAMNESGAKVVVITSPTYEGVVSDIKTISSVVHKKGGILIVDSAHGAHLGFCPDLPKSARSLGADIVIESAHKTLPCLTGAALLHICSHRVRYGDIMNRLGVFETSSPSYPILCSIDRALSAIKSEDLFTPYIKRLNNFYQKAQTLSHLHLFRSADFDMGKLVIACDRSNITGFELKDLLREKYGIETEMAMPAYTLAMTSVADTDEGFDRLLTALFEIDRNLKTENTSPIIAPPKTKGVLPFSHSGETDLVKKSDSAGKISAEFIYAYPPGSPIISIGEQITEDALGYIDTLSAVGAQIYSSSGNFPDFITIFKEKD